jgi:CrcB protein
MMIINILLVIAGGGLGAACRYLLTIVAVRWFGNGFPWGTLGVNLAGCFLIGLAFSLAGRNIITPQVRLFFITGFLGGLTTFSTYALESTNFWIGRESLAALIDITVNNLGGIILVFLGLWLGKQI